jgi:hypothetical protein
VQSRAGQIVREIDLGSRISTEDGKRLVKVTCDVDDRVSQNMRGRRKDDDRVGGLGMRFRVGGTKEWPSRQGTGEEARRT